MTLDSSLGFVFESFFQHDLHTNMSFDSSFPLRANSLPAVTICQNLRNRRLLISWQMSVFMSGTISLHVNSKKYDNPLHEDALCIGVHEVILKLTNIQWDQTWLNINHVKALLAEIFLNENMLLSMQTHNF